MWRSRSALATTAPSHAKRLNARARALRAERLARTEGHIGAVAFSHTGDPGSGEFGDAVILKAVGEVPDDLSEL
ncbi:hypothetical protein Nham_3659 [Nitrobacter hamburgensis X14]|jgi:hypothetical protein|uniref:Uncharacterized protein n=1 Tax=Nitrobacter hamburgensis (strain DSM 10229 / NCIMB 13809 / X14) TaxID=323097 RepID=Q1QHB0_NITHX|nr:hypothetical protein Nham_3659 [Nitrobacter hamburgensis X14]